LTLSGLTLGAAATSGNGGAVDETGGLLTVDRCAFVANSASGSGGGIFATGGLRLTNSLVRENSSFGGFGGGVYSTGPTTITATTFYHNSGKSGGGGLLFFGGGDLTVTACTFSANTSPVGGAGIFTLCATGTTVTIANCTLNQNETPGIGGGLLASGPGTLRLANDTVAGNHGNGGGLFLSPALGTPSAILLNTIVANNIDATNQASDISGTVIAAFSLVRSTKGATFIGYTGSDLFGVDPHLGPLQNNGGPTQTMALLAGSPAIDTGYDGVTGPPYFLTTDQRGHLRKVGLHVDIGAFEYMPPPPPPPPPPRRGRIF
jgi:predicted outer membrane repeat protein